MGGQSFLVFMSLLVAANAATCPEGFSFWYKENAHARPSCYKFVRTQMSWLQARRNCQNFCGDLVSIETSGENGHLISVITRDPVLRSGEIGYRHWGFWTGGNDLLDEGIWRWVANNNTLSYTNWNSGQPNNHMGQHCLQLMKDYNWKWGDIICSDEFIGSVCETEGN